MKSNTIQVSVKTAQLMNLTNKVREIENSLYDIRPDLMGDATTIGKFDTLSDYLHQLIGEQVLKDSQEELEGAMK